MEMDDVRDLWWVQTAPVQSEVKEDREAKIPLFEVSLQLWRLNLIGLWKVQRRLVLFLPTGDFSTPSSPFNNLYPCLHSWSLQCFGGCSFHCHPPAGSRSSASSPDLFQCCPTPPFSQALFACLHSSIWLMSHRNKNHSRDTMSDVWFHVSSFLCPAYSDG